MIEKKRTKETANELILEHFILGAIVLIEALIKILNSIIPSPNIIREPIYNEMQEEKTLKSEDINLDITWFSERSIKELRNMLKNVDILSNLTKTQLKDLILSNNEALEVLKTEYRRESLKKMTNHQIRSLLKGVEGISRFRKSELVEMVIMQDKIR